MKVQILGGGCPSCHALAANAAEAIEKAGVEATIEKITDADTITEMGALMTPALAIDGEIKRAGKVLNADEIVPFLTGA